MILHKIAVFLYRLALRALPPAHRARYGAETIDSFYTADVFMHTWDLARATGQDDRLDPEFCAALLGGMEPMEEIIRSRGDGPWFYLVNENGVVELTVP